MTVIHQSDSGHEVRIPRWSYARRSWNVALDSWDETRLKAILNFFHARQGRAYGFRFKDWMDYYAGMTLVPGTGLTYNTAATSELIGIGDGSDATWQLTKKYTSGSESITRNITRPKTGTVRIYVNGVQKTEATHYTVNYSTGLVTFTVGNIPPNTHEIRWAGEFDVPARFDTDQMDLNLETIVAGQWASIPIVEIRE